MIFLALALVGERLCLEVATDSFKEWSFRFYGVAFSHIVCWNSFVSQHFTAKAVQMLVVTTVFLCRRFIILLI